MLLAWSFGLSRSGRELRFVSRVAIAFVLLVRVGRTVALESYADFAHRLVVPVQDSRNVNAFR